MDLKIHIYAAMSEKWPSFFGHSLNETTIQMNHPGTCVHIRPNIDIKFANFHLRQNTIKNLTKKSITGCLFVHSVRPGASIVSVSRTCRVDQPSVKTTFKEIPLDSAGLAFYCVCYFPKDASMASLRTSQRTELQKILSYLWWDMTMAHPSCLTWQCLIHQGDFYVI